MVVSQNHLTPEIFRAEFVDRAFLLVDVGGSRGRNPF